MDGTLTPPRKKMNYDILNSLEKLQKSGFEIGILSGSDLDYINEQCHLIFDIGPIDPEKMLFFPCNGTKNYTFKNGNFILKEELNMRNYLGIQRYNNLIKVLLDSQTAVRYSLGAGSLPLSGTFIQYRGSMINWCPIGRDATSEDRETWVEIDNKHKIRDAMLRRLFSNPEFHDITIKKGGETSFDIFPNGWNKSYVWKYFQPDDTVYFIGDKCTPEGNDYEAFIKAGERGFKTSDPQQTIKIISEILKNDIPQ